LIHLVALNHSGGEDNNAIGIGSTVAGGTYNFARAKHSTVLGGVDNALEGECSTVVGSNNRVGEGHSGSMLFNAASCNGTLVPRQAGSIDFTDWQSWTTAANGLPGVKLAEGNRVESDRPGQVVFMAVNGIGINRRPSGDYALDVEGAIRSTEPSQLGISDERLKTHFRDVNDTECLEVVNSLELRDFRYSPLFKHHPTTGKRDDGFVRGLVAQQVERTLPSAVFTQTSPEELADGSSLDNFKLVDTQPVTVEMVGAVRALAARVLSLRARAQELRAKLEERHSLAAH